MVEIVLACWLLKASAKSSHPRTLLEELDWQQNKGTPFYELKVKIINWENNVHMRNK